MPLLRTYPEFAPEPLKTRDAGSSRSPIDNVTKPFRRIATRYEKTDESFAAMIYIAAAAITLR
jgi:transposase